MAVTYLADTNIVSEIMRPHPAPAVQEKWQQRHPQIAISAVTWHELLTGTLRLPASRRRTALEQFLYDSLAPSTPILPYDHAAATWHAAERTRLLPLGLTPPFADGQIAAIAASQNLILVTRNTSDFAHFAELQIENWFTTPF